MGDDAPSAHVNAGVDGHGGGEHQLYVGADVDECVWVFFSLVWG